MRPSTSQYVVSWILNVPQYVRAHHIQGTECTLVPKSIVQDIKRLLPHVQGTVCAPVRYITSCSGY